jgi:hypothetical protein
MQVLCSQKTLPDLDDYCVNFKHTACPPLRSSSGSNGSWKTLHQTVLLSNILDFVSTNYNVKC